MFNGSLLFIPIPVLIATDPYHLPRQCQLFLGAAQLNDLDIAVDEHRKTQRLSLRSLHPDLPLSRQDMEGYMSEVDLRRWADAHVDKPVGIVPFAVDDIDVNPAKGICLSPPTTPQLSLTSNLIGTMSPCLVPSGDTAPRKS